MAAVAERLVGRADEVGSIAAALSELGRGGSSTLELVGEPGIGKSRLLAELSARADERGFLVLAGRAAELERDLPFWVFVDALDEYVAGLSTERMDALDADVRTELATVLPSLRAPAAGGPPALHHERYRSHRAVRELLSLLAEAQPLVLVLDDLHWADPAALELLGALLRRPAAGAVLMAFALRPHQAPERLSAALQGAHRNGAVTRLALGALARQEADELLGDAVGARDAAVLFEESGGNPFYLEQLARALERPGQAPARLQVEQAGGSLVPPSVAAALAEELGLLAAGTRRFLEGAAVAGDPFDPGLAAAAAGASEPSALDALDELLRRDLVRSTEVPRRFRFRHPLLRRAVYEGAPGGWLLGAHERAAGALAVRGAPASARAHHVERAAPPGDAAAVAVLREAGTEAAHRAPASAERWFAAALRILPVDATPEDRVELLLGRSAALAATGRFTDSHAALMESLALVPAQATALRVRLTTACAAVELQIGSNQQAMDRLQGGLAELGDRGDAEVELLHGLAVNGLFGSDYDAMLGWATRAVDAARPLGDSALMAATLAVRAAGAALSGRAGTGHAYRDEAAEVIDALSDDALAQRLEGPAHLALAELYLDHFEASGSHAERALRIGRASGQGDLFPMILVVLGSALWIRGRIAEAVEVLDGGVEAARLLDGRHAIGWHLFNFSYASLAAGDVVLALETARESVALMSDIPQGPISAHAATALAAVLLETGDAEEAAELLLTGAGGPEMRLIGGGWRARYLEIQTRALLVSGRPEEAERATRAARECADVTALPMAGAMADRAAAALAMRGGDPAAAATLNLDAVAALEDVGDLYDAAGTRTLAGRSLAMAGDEDGAVAQLERAASDFASFGALRYRDEAERELRKLGRRIHRQARPGRRDEVGVASLTAREIQVARLVIDRRTNSEIAAALYLSHKTIEAHVHSMFVKLGVSSRAEIARAVERADAGATVG